ncbi:hypothetical protein CL621_04985 [archaeon]|nr:hypothetical protein [archaeon]|tara:strand:- start:1888 stop:2247 length:360 start_codon:yes stop_codon:yes gene_type:complete
MIDFNAELASKDIDLWSFPIEFKDDEDDYPYSTDATIDFSVELEARSYGVKSIIINTRNITLNSADQNLIIKIFEASSINGIASDEWEIVDEIDLKHKQIIPDRLELDWIEKKAYVYYG